VSHDGAVASYTIIHVKEGALSEGTNSITFPSIGKRGAFVMQSPRPQDKEPGSLTPATPVTFSITANDQPIVPALNLRKTTSGPSRADADYAVTGLSPQNQCSRRGVLNS